MSEPVHLAAECLYFSSKQWKQRYHEGIIALAPFCDSRGRVQNKKKNKLDPDITNANIKNAKKFFGYKPTVNFDQGYKNFLKWFLEYHK